MGWSVVVHCNHRPWSALGLSVVGRSHHDSLARSRRVCCISKNLSDCNSEPRAPVQASPHRALPTTRRLATCSLVAGAATALLLPRPAQAENGPLPQTCKRDDGAVETSPVLVPYTDPAGRFQLSYPCGWTRVNLKLSDDLPVVASFYNPEEPGAETLAVYRAAAPEGVAETSDLGSPQDLATALANVAPNGIVLDAYGTTHGGRSYMVVHVQFGGNTAGMFGAVREFRTVTIAQGVQYTLRVTTTRYRYLAFEATRDLLKRAADAFELLV